GLGHSQRLLPWAFQSRRNSVRTAVGSGTQRSLLLLRTPRINPLRPWIAMTSSEAASLMRRPQAYISRKPALAIGLLTRSMMERASASERTPGSRLRLGLRTLFLGTTTTHKRASGHRETGCQHGRAGTCRAPRRADRADAGDSCAPRPRSAHPASADSGRRDRAPPARTPPAWRAPARPRPCLRSYAYATVSSR